MPQTLSKPYHTFTNVTYYYNAFMLLLLTIIKLIKFAFHNSINICTKINWLLSTNYV